MSFWAFLQDRRAGVAPIFALAIIPVIGLVGAAVDYSRANSVRTTLQAALDATALAMAKSAQSLTEAQLLEKSNAHFHALFNRPEAKNVTLAAAYTSSGGSTLTLTASGAVDTTFTRIMGYSQLNVGSSATLDTTTTFQGNILALASITMNTGATIGCGSALASTGAVTMDTNTVGAGCGTITGQDNGLSGGLTVPAGGGMPTLIGGGTPTGGHAIGTAPEPGTYAITLAGLALLGFLRRRRKAAAA